MKRLILPLLLLSIGLNIGLGITLKRQRSELDRLPPWVFRDRGPEAGRPGGGPHHGGHMGRLREMRDRIQPEMETRQAAFKAAREALYEALAREPMDEDEILARVGDVITVQGGIDSLMTSNLVEELKGMAPESRREVIRLLDRFDDRRRGRFGGRRGGRPSVSP